MVTGAVAAIVYGEPRLTNDIDIVIALAAPEIPRLQAAYPDDAFYVPPTDAITREIERSDYGHFNIIHRATALKADFYPAGEDPLHRWAMDNRREIALMSEHVMIAPPEYVIIRKLQYYRAGGSDRHVRDVRGMLRISEGQIDRSTLARLVDQLGLEKEWQEITAPRA